MKAFWMFGFFSRKPKKTPGQPAPPSAGPSEVSLPLLVVVRRSAVEVAMDEPFDLVFAVERFTQTMVSEGLYRHPEISPKAMQVYHADLYSAEVKNGGHSQFIYNSGQEIQAIIASARAGLAAIGARGQLATLEKMSVWVAEHPEEAAGQTGFEGGREDFLDTLDDVFYDADEAEPMQGLMARWIASWPDLKVVADDDYDDVIHQLVMANPQRAGRLLHLSVAELARQMIGWRAVGAALACAKLSPPEVKLAFGMARVLNVDGEQQMTYQLRTSAREPRLCVVTDAYAAIYEHIAPEDPPVIRAGENPFGANAPRIGTRLARVEASEITTVVNLAEEYHAPVAIDLLLRKAGFDPTDAIVSANSVVPKDEGAVLNWVVIAGGNAFFVQSSPNGSALLRGKDDAKLAEAGMPELEEHFARSAAAG